MKEVKIKFTYQPLISDGSFGIPVTIEEDCTDCWKSYYGDGVSCFSVSNERTENGKLVTNSKDYIGRILKSERTVIQDIPNRTEKEPGDTCKADDA